MTTDIARYVAVQASTAVSRGPATAGQMVEARSLGREVVPRTQASPPAVPVASLIEPRHRRIVLVAAVSVSPAVAGVAIAGWRLVEAVGHESWAAPAGVGLGGVPVVLVVGWLHTRRARTRRGAR